MDIQFLITTYNRQRSCQALVDLLQDKGDILVLNDGCDYVINGCKQYFLGHHNGKMYYGETVKTLFSLRGKYKYYFMLPDDFLPEPDMVDEAIRIWEKINDPQKICLNLIVDRIGMSCWTKFNPVDMGGHYRTGWVDMCFLCENKFFDTVQIQDIRTAYWGNKVGSGIGSMISRYLFRRDYHFYQLKYPLLSPQPEHFQSQMYSENQANIKHRRHISASKKIIFDTREGKK